MIAFSRWLCCGGALALFASGTATAQPKSAALAATTDPLWSAFATPPPEAKASSYWWWKGDLNAAEMGRQLRLLKAAGLGGAHIIPWRSEPAYLSPEWLQLLRTAADVARAEGMFLDLSANATWPFRGQWVPEEESLQKVEVETYTVEGPRTFPLPRRPSPKGKNASQKMAITAAKDRILFAQLAPAAATDLREMREVTAELVRKESPAVAVPAGKHTLRLVRLYVGVKSQADFGRVPDHFNSRAIENYLKGFAERVAPALGGKLSNGLRALYCDSIEISDANWTSALPEEFRRRHGYDLLPYLPLVLAVDAAEKSAPPIRTPLEATVARVRHDFCRTLADLFLEATARTFSRWCHANGVLCRWQAYGWPSFYGIEDGYRIPDMPEGNNWLIVPSVFDHDVDVHGWPVWQKMASSGAHLAGRRIASTEAATVTEGKFTETLDLLKRSDDFNFISGINHSFLHGFCYSPASEGFPGRDQYGTYFSEHNPWWPWFPRWTQYNARLSATFQASQAVAQVALLFRTADTWAQSGLHRHPYQLDPPWAHQVWRWINQNGANADYVSDAVLQQAKFEQGQIVFGPMRYAALWVLGARTLEPDTAKALARYAQAGGKIVFLGAVPEASPGLRDAEAGDREVRTTMQSLFREYPERVFRRDPPGAGPRAEASVPWVDLMNRWRKSTSPGQCLTWADQLLTDLRIRRSVQWAQPTDGLYQVHYRNDRRDLFFFANTTEAEVPMRAEVTSAGKRIERWDPETGSRQAVPVDREGRVALTIKSAESLLLVAAEGPSSVEPRQPAELPGAARQEIAGPWTVEFRPANGEPFEVTPFPLAGLHQSHEARMHRFAGQATYRTKFDWIGRPVTGVHLDLGAIPNGLTEVTLNGRPLGVRWYGRHEYSVGDALKAGENDLKVTVVTTLFNRLRKDGEAPIAAGLVGPVVLYDGSRRVP